MKKYAKAYSITLIAYCLMPNHYHFLLRQDGDVSPGKFINVLFNVYVQAVNRKQGRKGTLFGGRFKCIHITRNEYLIHLCRYIHFNPVEAGIIASPENWIYSNYRDWIGLRKGTLIDRDFILAYFQQPEEYRKFVIEYRLEKEMQQTINRYYLD
jgi:REP element-mobilizing transposase RayT